jgi:hypothetical protein
MTENAVIITLLQFFIISKFSMFWLESSLFTLSSKASFESLRNNAHIMFHLVKIKSSLFSFIIKHTKKIDPNIFHR